MAGTGTSICATAWSRPNDVFVLGTHELAFSGQRLAAFLQIPEDSIDLRKAHLNRASGFGSMARLIDRTYLDEMVHAICGDNMSRYFPSERYS